MNNPQHPKRKRTLTPDLPPTHRRAIVDEEDDEAEERSGLSGDEAFEEEEEEEHGLIGRRTILISGLKPTEYAAALTRLQGAGLPIIADEAPYCTVTEVMGLDIPESEIEETARKLSSCWRGPGRITIDVFQPARERIKVAIRVANKGDFAVVTLEALAEFLTRKGIQLDLSHASLSIVVPGTWLLLLEDAECANKIYALCRVVLLGKELEVGPWKDGYRQAEHRIYVQGLADTASRRAILDFLRRRCGEIVDHHFGRLEDSRMAPWMTVQFKTAAGMDRAIELSGKKSFNGKPVTIVRSKSQAEREADLRNQDTRERRKETRVAEVQARQQRQAGRRVENANAVAEYERRAAEATATFTGLL